MVNQVFSGLARQPLKLMINGSEILFKPKNKDMAPWVDKDCSTEETISCIARAVHNADPENAFEDVEAHVRNNIGEYLTETAIALRFTTRDELEKKKQFMVEKQISKVSN